MADEIDKREIMSRKAAKARGLKFYFTGKPCPHGHISQRYTSENTCLSCSKLVHAALREKTRQRKASRPLSPIQAARLSGEVRYRTGRPCPRGHYAERLSVNGACVACGREDRMARETNATREQRRAYRKANAERYRSHVRNRRAKSLGLDGDHTQDDILDIHRLQRGLCAYCPAVLTKWHADHIIPKALGGHNGRRNIQLTCRSCNLRKSSKDPIDFAREIGLLI